MMRAVISQSRRAVAGRFAAAVCRPAVVGSVQAPVRAFSSVSPAMSKLSKGLASELQYEKDTYEKPSLSTPEGWNLEDKEGDVNIALSKTLSSGKTCKIEWQLKQPTPWEEPEMEGQESPMEDNSNEFQITVEDPKSEKGLVFYCTTQSGEEHRFIIGNVKNYTSSAERDSATAYNGPDFEDLDEKLLEPLDEFLAEVGLSDEVCDFIDASAVDKERREYMRWLDSMKNFFS